MHHAPPPKRKKYSKPRVTRLGSVQSLTHGRGTVQQFDTLHQVGKTHAV
jgi:hypothetical protein